MLFRKPTISLIALVSCYAPWTHAQDNSSSSSSSSGAQEKWYEQENCKAYPSSGGDSSSQNSSSDFSKSESAADDVCAIGNGMTDPEPFTPAAAKGRIIQGCFQTTNIASGAIANGGYNSVSQNSEKQAKGFAKAVLKKFADACKILQETQKSDTVVDGTAGMSNTKKAAYLLLDLSATWYSGVSLGTMMGQGGWPSTIELMQGLAKASPIAGQNDARSCKKRGECKKCPEHGQKLAKVINECVQKHNDWMAWFKKKIATGKDLANRLLIGSEGFHQMTKQPTPDDPNSEFDAGGSKNLRSFTMVGDSSGDDVSGNDPSSGGFTMPKLNAKDYGYHALGAPEESNQQDTALASTPAETNKARDLMGDVEYQASGGEGALGSLGTDYAGASAVPMSFSLAAPGEHIGTTREARLPNGMIDPRKVYTVGKLRMVRQMEVKRDGRTEVVLVEVSLLERARRRVVGIDGSRLPIFMKRGQQLNQQALKTEPSPIQPVSSLEKR